MTQVIALRGLIVQHVLIISDDGVDLIDGGFLLGIRRLKRALAEHGKTLADVRSLLLTHGHLDHSLNAAKLQELTGCRVHAPLADREHVHGSHCYQGWSRVCGWLERMGRFLLRYRVPEVDHWFQPGEVIHGLEVIGLPGHTVGHCGFLLREEKLLFAGDLFANHFGKPTLPPTIINDDSELGKKSILKAARMDLRGVILNHGSEASQKEGLRAMVNLANDQVSER